ncbi:MAG: salicylate synthase [Rhodococcus sp. (in: high G+C Gram-positive bacteria)]
MTVVEDTTVGVSGSDETSLQMGLRNVVALAESGLADEYVVYEDRNNWVFAGGTTGSVVLRTRTITTAWRDGAPRTREWSGNPADALDAACAELTRDSWNAYGLVGFDFAVHLHGTVSGRGSDDVLAHLIVPRFEVRFGADHGSRVEVAGSDVDRDAVLAVLESLGESSDSFDEGGNVQSAHGRSDVDAEVDNDNYRDRVAEAVNEIRRGDYSKVILSRRVAVPFHVDLPATYRAGRTANTPARSFLLRLGDISAAGFSPELVASVDAHGVVITRPLAGTRAFGRGMELDAAAREDLERDPKEISEHAVSVRTSFLELESVARHGSTVVSEFMSVRERGSVQHLGSTVRARLREGVSSWGALAAVFPAVTASGIPKREAIDAITRLEDTPRGLYSGAVVKASSTGELEAALVLRAVYEQNGSAWLRAGAGVVGQSTPDREFDETCEKLASVAPYLIRTKEKKL